MAIDFPQARDIFIAAVEKGGGNDRTAFLDEACGTDEELRRHVDLLLGAHGQSRCFLDEGALAFPPINQPLSEKPGDCIGPYKLLQQIGEGGFGVVFLAEQERPVRRKVALKVIKPGMDTRQVIARFEAERQAVAMMDHPNIAKVHDAGATENGRPYFVMELVQGVPITEYCDQCNLTTRERLELFITVCEAVQHAHQKGVIHRDIKPTNVLVAMQDGRPSPKIIDFGVAKAIDQRLTEHTLTTAFAQMVGTPLYMSPEQAELSPLGVDTRSDIYSLGVLLYELLAGTTPFDKDRLQAASYDELRQIIREEEPPRPSTRISTLAADLATTVAEHRRTDAHRLRQAVRGELDWIVMKCLEKDRNRRYETPNSLARDIRRNLNDETVEACPPSAIYRFRKFARRNSGLLATTAVVVASLLLGATISTWQAIRAVKAERQQAQLRATAERARAESESHRINAEKAESEETRLRKEAELREAESRRQAYASDINLAQQALAEDRLGTAQSLLARHRPQSGQEDLRGWEWRYLWRQTQGDALFELCRTNRLIYSLATSFDGRLVALGEGIENGVSVWDLRSRRQVARLLAGDSEVYVAFSPTAPVLAFSSISGPPTKRLARVQFWDAENESIVGEFSLGARCLGLAFSADGRTLVSATGEPENQIAVWPVPAGKKLAGFEKKYVIGVDEGIPLAVTADVQLAAYASSGSLHVCDLTSGRDLWSAKAADDHLIALAFSPDGKTLATGAGYREQTVRLWDVESGKESRRLDGHSGWIGALVFSPDGQTLFSSSNDRTIRIWNLSETSNPSSRILRGHDEDVWRLALLPDGQTLVSSSENGVVYAWDIGSSRRNSEYAIVPASICAWQFSPDSQSVVTLNAHGAVRRWRGPDFVNAEQVLDLGDFDTHWGSSVISADNRWLAIRRHAGTIEVWDLVRRAEHQHIATKSETPWRFLEDGKKLVVLESGTDLMHLWDVPKGTRLETWRRALIPDRDSMVGDISPDGRWCLTIGLDGTAVLRDIVRGREEDPHLGAKDPFGVTYSPDSRLFAVSSSRGGGYAKVWETGANREIANLGGGKCVGFSPDGKRLAIGAPVWDLESRRQPLDLNTFPGQARGFARSGVTFSPDGNVIGSVARGELYLWPAPSWDEIE